MTMQENSSSVRSFLPAPLAESPATMSSREIADICEKRHDHVIRDIEKMFRDIADPKFGASDFQSAYTDSTGRSLKEYRLPKDLTVTLITGYRADLRYRVIKRLEEYETGRIIDPAAILNDPAAMRGLLLTYTEKVMALEGEVEGMRPQVQALERIAVADGSLCVTDAAKTLQVRPKDLFSFLRSHGWVYRRPNTDYDIAYQSKLAAGLLEHKTTTVYRSDGSEKVTTQVRVTPKGLTRLAQEFPPVAGTA